jgi:hypothetical protein
MSFQYESILNEDVRDISEFLHGRGKTSKAAFHDLARKLAKKNDWDAEKAVYTNNKGKHIIKFGLIELIFSTYVDDKTNEFVFVIIT